MHLDLYVDDNSIESPYLSRRFLEEIIFDNYLNFSSFLSKSEIEIITPNSYGEIVINTSKPITTNEIDRISNEMSDLLTTKSHKGTFDNLISNFVKRSEKLEDRERDPLKLKNVLQKVENQLISEYHKLPLVHLLYDENDLENEILSIKINNIEASIEGDLYFEDNYDFFRKKIQIKSYSDDYGKIDLLLDATPIVEINNKNYIIKTISKAEQFKPEFQLCYKFLDEAISYQQKILWEFE